MVRRVLHDDVIDNPTPIRLNDDDGCPPAEEVVNPSLTVRVRTRDEFTVDGDPTFEWAIAVVGEAIAWEEIREVDSIAGIEVGTDTATMLYDGEAIIDSSAMVSSSFGPTYRVLSATQVDDVLHLDLMRVEDPDGEG